jgi:hypothetical protein
VLGVGQRRIFEVLLGESGGVVGKLKMERRNWKSEEKRIKK